MNEKAIDSSADIGLILILPIALLIIFLFATWPLLLVLVVASVSWNLWQGYQWQQWCQKVNPVFHQLIKENRGSITALDLAMKTNFSAAIAKRYLDTKTAEFGAQYQDDEDQGRVYYFMTASTLGKILDDSELPSLPEQDNQIDSQLLSENQNQLLQLEDPTPPTHTEKQATSFSNHIEAPPEQSEPADHIQSVPEYLLQSELAKRLDVHSSTVYKRRDDPDFPEWSRSKDPEGIAWKFIPDTKQFCPLETEPQ